MTCDLPRNPKLLRRSKHWHFRSSWLCRRRASWGLGGRECGPGGGFHWRSSLSTLHTRSVCAVQDARAFGAPTLVVKLCHDRRFHYFFYQKVSNPTPLAPPPCRICFLITVNQSYVFLCVCVSEWFPCALLSCTACMVLGDSSMQMSLCHTQLIAKSLHLPLMLPDLAPGAALFFFLYFFLSESTLPSCMAR